MDRISKEHRSWNMSRIRDKDTSPEKAVRSLLYKLGYRYHLHRKDLPGKPDIVLPKHKTVIFVHGCYWHRHPGCRYAYKPKTRIDFWTQKFKDNVKRYHLQQAELIRLGWRVLVIWECEIADQGLLVSRINNAFSGASRDGEDCGNANI